MRFRVINLLWLLLSLGIIFLDQYTKWLAVNYLTFHQPLAILPGFNLILAHNTGAAFNLLASADGWQRWLFAAIAIVVSAICTFWLSGLAAAEKWTAFGISLILGGALGNLYDRLLLGYVIDFIQLYYKAWSWPVFNIADSAICVGAGILILFSFRATGK